jgi:hypothetical protein
LGFEDSPSGKVKMSDETTALFCFFSVILIACGGVVEINPANLLGDPDRWIFLVPGISAESLEKYQYFSRSTM